METDRWEVEQTAGATPPIVPTSAAAASQRHKSVLDRCIYKQALALPGELDSACICASSLNCGRRTKLSRFGQVAKQPQPSIRNYTRSEVWAPALVREALEPHTQLVGQSGFWPIQSDEIELAIH